MKYLKTKYKNIRHLPVFIFIWLPFAFIIVLDIIIEIYHRISFPIYKVPCIVRSEYIKIDRHKLSYLSFRQKIYCVYCGYVNGVFAYWVKIAGETEKYWCGIKHKPSANFHEPAHHSELVDYGDEQQFIEQYK
ncbi:MAG: hypothetical protein ACKKL6_01135 [Candidatus Komeilibacteria bacterium]